MNCVLSVGHNYGSAIVARLPWILFTDNSQICAYKYEFNAFLCNTIWAQWPTSVCLSNKPSSDQRQIETKFSSEVTVRLSCYGYHRQSETKTTRVKVGISCSKQSNHYEEACRDRTACLGGRWCCWRWRARSTKFRQCFYWGSVQWLNVCFCGSCLFYKSNFCWTKKRLF